MSYTALYRKFRPQEFQDVKGQEHIVTTLKNQMNANRIGHAYLFCGTRGTGKTTIAKLFAKAVNCENPTDGSPCGECPSCKAIQEGNSMNVIEIDAASNNGVDNIREIREEVAYSPTEGRYKVYIIDEVHMLSIGAFNALLKTLEEPPSYVIFILATTEVHKIPVTILSRCQRYDFRRITIDTISGRLMELMEKEQVEIEEKAIRYIAKAADGSMRDALSLLDQCIAFYLGQKLTYDNVLDVLGAVDTEIFSQMLRLILQNNIAKVIELLDHLIIQGREPGQFVNDFTWYLRNLLLIKNSEQMDDVLDISTENLILLKEEAKMVETEEIMRYIRIFSELSNQIRFATQKRVLIEIALIKLCKPQMEQNLEAILERVSQLEKKIEDGAGVMPVSATAILKKEESTKVAKKVSLPAALPDDIKAVVENWRSIILDMPGTMRAFLKSAHLSMGEDNSLWIIFDDELAESFVNSDSHKKELADTISAKIGKEVQLQIKLNESNRPFEESYADIEKLINMDIVVEDEME